MLYKIMFLSLNEMYTECSMFVLDSPRSDVDEASKPMLKRPSTAPGKRLLSSGSTLHPGGRPRSAWGDNSTTCHLVHGDTESENEKPKKSW